MKKQVQSKIILINPKLLLFMGTLMGVFPLFIKNNITLQFYSRFRFTNEILTIYVLGYLFFVLGFDFNYLIQKKNFVNRNYVNRNYIVIKYNEILLSLVALLIVLIINIKKYGGIPLIMILSGRNIKFVNETQMESSTGTFGIQILLIYTLIILVQPLIIGLIEKRISNKYKKIVLLTLCAISFSSLYAGKRQYMFIVFFSLFCYIYQYSILNNPSITKKVITYGKNIFYISVLIFILVGLIRIDKKISFTNALYPIQNYITLPYMNLSNIVIYHSINEYKFSVLALNDILAVGLPSILKSRALSVENIPLIEVTSPSTIYGNIFWNFGYFGIIIFMFFLGTIISNIYIRSLLNRKMYITIYSFCVWPLISIYMYNHFLNMMYYIIPISIAILINIYDDMIINNRKNIIK